MFEFEILKNFLIAIALGALIGLEREYAQAKGKYTSFAGIRTFPLISLSAALITYLSQIISSWLLIAGTIIFSSLIVLAYYTSSIKSKYHGITTAMAALFTFFIGILCFYQEITLAVAITVGVTILLYARTFLHQFARKIKKKELVDTLKFAVIAFVILPFLPNQGYGPYEIFNPFVIWLMVVFISGISFVGYILMKWLGERGIIAAGIFGGLASSTAVATSFAARSKKETRITHALALGVISANAIMFIRVLIVVFVLNRNLAAKLLLPMVLLSLISIIFAYILFRKSKRVKKHKLELSSPFTLKPALKFGAFFAVILALIKIADIYLSSKGIYLVSFISGFADVDAITISLSQLAKKDLVENIARNGIILAALTNTAVKGGIAYFFGSKQFGKIVMGIFFTLILIGLGIFFLL
jgi:uncharacterized membrane protein (DUF4010 family)